MTLPPPGPIDRSVMSTRYIDGGAAGGPAALAAKESEAIAAASIECKLRGLSCRRLGSAVSTRHNHHNEMTLVNLHNLQLTLSHADRTRRVQPGRGGWLQRGGRSASGAGHYASRSPRRD